jgi:hypothetical protein
MKRFFFLLLATLATGCLVEAGQRGNGNGNGNPDPTPPAAVPPMVVDIDADKTMNATGGDGVGVFIEYKSGPANGTWHIWWTCDTTRTRESCAFTVRAALASGVISNPRGDQLLSADSLALGADGAVTATSTVSTNVAGMYFDAPANVRVTVDATLRGVPKTGDYLFFVQNGQVNGGYQGTLTNPLILQPKQ